MNSTRWGWLLVVVGLIVVALAVLADPIGIGEGSGFGWKQAVGIVAGGLAAVVGLLVLRRQRSGPTSAQPPVTP
jgi:uncharacterized membrane protein